MKRHPKTLDPRQVAEEILPAQRQLVLTRVLFALRFMPDCPVDKITLVMVIAAAYGKVQVPGGMIRVPSLGDNSRIDKDRNLWSRFTDSDPADHRRAKDYGERMVCTVDDLNRGLGWLLRQIDATDAEYTELVNKINAWVARDETQVGIHAERMRDSLTPAGKSEV